MQRILLALGHRRLEEYLEVKLGKQCTFVGSVVYREAIFRAVEQKKPDILVIRESLDGNENIMTIIYDIRIRYPDTRIVFVAGRRKPGDILLATLVSYGVYDILYGESVNAQEIIAFILKAQEYKDVKLLQPVPILDETSNKMLFEAPTTEKEIVEVIKEVPVASAPASTIPTTLTSNSKEEAFNPFKFLGGKKKNTAKEPKITEKVVPVSKQKIITFMGSKHGVGNTSLAFNTAIMLAKKGRKTIYLEVNDRNPSVAYWYDLNLVDKGIETAIQGLQENDFEKIKVSIVRMTDLKLQEGDMHENYKRFPDGLDSLFFSKEWITKNKTIEKPLAKELYLYLLFQLGYDYVILDIPPEINNEFTTNALCYSNHIFITLTQDVATIGYNIIKLDEVTRLGINLDKKLYYILNQFEEGELGVKDIKDWLQIDQLATIPFKHKEFIGANYRGLPIILDSNDSSLKNSFNELFKIVI